jgi:quinol monooxygenase YgiN
MTVTFEVTARMKIRDGELAGFKEQAAEIMKIARELDTTTLRYDWFVSADGTACEVREAYVDPDGLIEHNLHVREARDDLFREHASGHDMTIYGKPSPALAELIDRMSGHATFNRFAFFEGLESEPSPKGGTPMFEATARLKIRGGALDGFRRQAAELVHQMKQMEARPLRYDWYLSEDGTECEVREAYVDADALLKHQQAIAEPKMKLFREFVESHAMEFYGDPSPALVGALTAMGTPYTTFRFFQGLDAEVEAPEKVSV